jgi:glycosyltransferase involved in cell wall biosynthesis
MKRVLIITYYWPPSGGSGVQRWLKFVKYLREFGWEPVVYTPLNPEMPYEDTSLLCDEPEGLEVLKTKIFEPYQLYNLFTGRKRKARFQHGFLQSDKNEYQTLSQRLSVWIRGNLFVPDARMFWIRPSVRFLAKYLKDHPVDAIVSTGPPHSMHLIALRIRQKTNIPWLADFRDPWTGIYYFDKLRVGQKALRKHKMLEKACLDHTDLLVTVGQTMQQDFKKLTDTTVEVITNGYDEDDLPSSSNIRPADFTIMYSGIFLPDQNPVELWPCLSQMRQSDPEFQQSLKLHFLGRTDASILADIQSSGLDDCLRLTDYVPHAEVTVQQQYAAVLLLSINRIQNAPYILTGKVFEYLAARRPILAFCPPQSDVAEIIRQTYGGWVVPFGDTASLNIALLEAFAWYKSGQQWPSVGIEKFSRKVLTQRMAQLLDKLTARD